MRNSFEELMNKENNETNRIEAFSDAVFAIAITLLVLEIKMPSHEVVAGQGLAYALVLLWPSYLAFITSFFTILVIWIHHHWIFSLVRKSDHLFLYWNGLLLLVVTFVPFPTGLLAEYLLNPDAKVATSLYTGNILAISLAFHGLWRHASSDGRLLATHAQTLKQEEAAQITKHYRLGPPLYFIAFCLSFFSEIAGIAFCLLLAIAFAIRGWPTARQCPA